MVDSSKFYRYFEIPYEIIDSKITTTNLIYPNSDWKLSSRHSTDYKIQKMFVEEVETAVRNSNVHGNDMLVDRTCAPWFLHVRNI